MAFTFCSGCRARCAASYRRTKQASDFACLPGSPANSRLAKPFVCAGNLGVDASAARGESRDHGADGDRLDRKASSHVTFSHDGSILDVCRRGTWLCADGKPPARERVRRSVRLPML